MEYLDELRQEIDLVDRELVELFERRMEIVGEIGKYKVENNLPIFNPLREEEVIKTNMEYLKNKDYQIPLRDFYINLMNLSKEYQNNKIDSNKS